VKFIPILIFAAFIAGGMFSSCKKHTTEPPQDTTTHPCDTCNKPCDTCNLNKDSLSHAYIWKEYINAIPLDNDMRLSSVWVFGSNDMIIVGDRLWYFDGTTFSPIDAVNNTYHTSMNGGLSGSNIFAFSKSDYWLVSGSIALHTSDGKYFDDNRKGAVNACWGTSSNDMFFVGNGGHIFHYDGTTFVDMISNTTKDLTSIWGTNHNNVWACGANVSTGKTTILHFDGSSWQEDPLALTHSAQHAGLFATWVVDSAGTPFVATSGSNVYRKTGTGGWRNDTTLVPNNLGGDNFVGIYLLSGNTANDFMGAGSWGWVGHWNGKTWKKYDELYNYGIADFTPQALSVKGNTACVVGIKSGQKWMAVGTRK